jgi:hypothetical protein
MAPVATVVNAQGQGQAAGQRTPSLSIPVAAENFTGTLRVTRFANIGGAVNAIGLLTGTVTTAEGPVSIVRSVELPVQVGGGADQPITAQAVCDILHLELGPLDLDLLGVVVHLNRIVLDIDAVSGPGNLLGNLLCAVVGLLDDPGGLSQVLNQILGIIGA